MSDGEVCSHVKVVVRVRPFNNKEKDGNYKKVVQVVDNHMLIFDPKEEEVTFFRGQRVGKRDVRKRANKDLKFVFDSVFREDSSQVEVFENTTKAIVDGVLNGYNCTGETFYFSSLNQKITFCVMYLISLVKPRFIIQFWAGIFCLVRTWCRMWNSVSNITIFSQLNYRIHILLVLQNHGLLIYPVFSLHLTMLEEFCMVGVYIYLANNLVIYVFFKWMLLKSLPLFDTSHEYFWCHYDCWFSD